MRKSFYLLKESETNYLESIDTASIISLGDEELELLRNCNEEVINFLSENRILSIKKDEINEYCAMILVNDFCNLKCSYCFEKDNCKSHNELTDKTYELISNRLKEFNDITFTGGEPLLSFDVIKKICELISSKRLNGKYSLITNGLIFTDEQLRFLNENEFNIQISLDGSISKDNNKLDRTNRKIENKILENIRLILTNYQNIKLDLRINFCKSDLVDFENKLDSLFAFLEPYLDKISIDLKLVDLPYGDKEYLSFVEKHDVYIKFYDYLYKKGIELPFRFVSGGYCMARGPKTLLLDPLGNRYPCFSFVENEEFKISLENTNFFEQLKDCEKECILHDICNVGCLYENYCDTGKLINQCDFELLDDLNKRLFLYKLRELKYIQTSIEEEVQHVEAFSINI